jgi:transcriptional regulator with XRE-family HTH domain
MSDLGDKIKSYRLSIGVSQQQLAAELGVTKSYLSHIEAGRRTVPPAILELIGERLQHNALDTEIYTVTVQRYGDSVYRAELRAVSLVGALEAASALPEPAWQEVVTEV